MLTKKTKIICTMGPATDDDEVLKDLMRSGMDIARLNFSHGDHEEQLGRIKRIKKFREELNLPIAILLDTKGPEIRTGLLETDDDVELVTGQEYTLTTRDIKGNNEITSITYAELPQDVEAGNTILIDDGLIELKVKEIKDGTDIVCDVINGGLLGSRKGVNVPNVRVNLPSITEKDKADIEFGLENGIDFIAASFIRNAEAVEEIKDINLEIGAANLFLQRAENQDELKVILAKGEMAHFHVTKQENQLEMSYKKNGKISREETDEIIVQIPENHHLENMSVSIGAGKLKAENITVMERLGLEVGAGKAKLKNMHVRNLAIECGVGKCHYEGVLEHDMKVQCGVGQVKAELDAEESDYNYSISCALGKIKINDNSMGTFASEKTIQHANARGNIALECGLGNIHVTTRV